MRRSALDTSLRRSGFSHDIPDPTTAANAFWEKHRFAPINHMIVARREIAESRPKLVGELFALFAASKAASLAPRQERDAAPIGRDAVAPSVAMALHLAQEQDLLPRPLTLDEVWEGLPPM